MNEKLDLFKCRICTNLIEIVQNGEGELVCCGEKMEKIIENKATSDNTHFAHIKETESGEKIITIEHVMTPEHHIEFIEIISNDGKYLKRKYLKENEPAQNEIKCDCKEGFCVRLHCNLDGCWVTKY